MHAWVTKKRSTPRVIANGLVVIDDVIPFNTEAQLVDLLSKIREWQDLVGQWGTLKGRRYGWGDSPIDHRNRDSLPPLIEAIGKQLNELFRDVVPDLPPRFTSCTANRYPVGEGLGLHQDGGAWQPYVVGLTLGSARYMEFLGEGRRIQIQTKRCSAYVFWGKMYTDYHHASLKGATRGKYFQEATAYSLTYRHVRTSVPRDTYEERQSRAYLASETNSG